MHPRATQRYLLTHALQVTITPTAADGNFVTAIWGSDADLYTVLQACPTTARDTVVSGSPTFDDTAIADAVSKAIYGSDVVTAAGVDSATISGSTLTLARGGSEWVYAITEVSLTSVTRWGGLKIQCDFWPSPVILPCQS